MTITSHTLFSLLEILHVVAITTATLSLKILRLKVAKNYFDHISHSKEWKSQISNSSWISNLCSYHTKFSWLYRF